MYLHVFLIGRWQIEVFNENGLEVTLQPSGSEKWSKWLSIDEMGGRYAVVEFFSDGLWIFAHDGK